jgi:hypothetical protein
MHHHLLAAVVALTSLTTTTKPVSGFHPGPAYFAVWIITIGLLTTGIVYVVRLLKRQRRVSEAQEGEDQSPSPNVVRPIIVNPDRDE